MAVTGVLLHRSANLVAGKDHRVAYYQDSMHPWIKSDQPGKCTICEMDLTAVFEGEKGFSLKPGTLALNSNSITALHVQTELVSRGKLHRSLRLAGNIVAKESKKITIAAPAAGRIQATSVEFSGATVQKGQSLVTLFSSELVQRRAYLRSVGGDQSSLARGLVLASGNDPYLGELPAPQSGIITEKNCSAGQYVTEGERLFTLVDDSVVWFQFDVYDQQLSSVKAGQNIEIHIPALPGKKIASRITFIDSKVDELTRTVKARAELTNPWVTNNGVVRRLLSLGLYADATVDTVGEDTLLLPRSAVLFGGNRSYVFIDRENGSYTRRAVGLGRAGNDQWEVLRGLESGDRVVTAGNTLLDAQAQLASNGTDELPEIEPSPAGTPASAPGESLDLMPAAIVMDNGSRSGPMSATSTEAMPMPDKKMAVAEDHSMAEPMASVPSSHQQMASSAQAMHHSAKAAASPAEAPMNLPDADQLSQTAVKRSSGMAVIMSPGSELQNMRRQSIIEGLAHDAEMAGGQTNDPVAVLKQSRVNTLNGLLEAADGIGAALATDNLKVFYQRASALPALFTMIRSDFASDQALFPILQRVIDAGLPVARTGNWQSVHNLTDARQIFVPYSKAMVELASQLKKTEANFSAITIIRSTNNTNGWAWIQTSPTPKNPFLSGPVAAIGLEVMQ